MKREEKFQYFFFEIWPYLELGIYIHENIYCDYGINNNYCQICTYTVYVSIFKGSKFFPFRPFQKGGKTILIGLSELDNT